MSPVSCQTIKLSKGKHPSPAEGACVMELASMLAGEPFSDHPASVCPVIGSFLRAYNDSVDDHRRQSLYAYASEVVGSRACEQVHRQRAERLAAWAPRAPGQRWTRVLHAHRPRPLGSLRKPPIDTVGSHSIRSITKHTDETHAAVLDLIDELLAIGTSEPAPGAPAPGTDLRTLASAA